MRAIRAAAQRVAHAAGTVRTVLGALLIARAFEEDDEAQSLDEQWGKW